ncbi:MAG: sugar nucleotide-binding protein, partial [Aestuariivita sp.]|uniref:sugar nucleotide-binding protein n=1 Tax=Aestuariivita sp. TaxID=1872407 RepID=UPI003BAF21B7
MMLSPEVKWSGKFGQRAKMYPTRLNGYKNDKAANIINNTAVFWLSEIARDSGARLIHTSTDYVFDGKAYLPYREVDQVNPVSSYGKSKVDGENAILRTLPM